MENSIRLINCKELDVMASIEYYVHESHDSYYSQNILFIIKRGNLNLKVGNKVYSYGKNKNVLVKRFTKGKYFKTFTKKEGYAKIYAIAFHEKLIKNILKNIPVNKEELMDESEIPVIQEISPMNENLSFHSFLEEIFDSNIKIDENKVQSHIALSLQNILTNSPEVYNIFRRVSIPIKADLEEFMQYNYLERKSVNELARLSGRSLATFYRDFQTKFQSTPYQWILNKRLEDAFNILTNTSKTASNIYTDLGFLDLAHFSKAFKKRFGITPSQLSSSK